MRKPKLSMEKTVPVTLTPEQGQRVADYIRTIDIENIHHKEFLIGQYSSLKKETLLFPTEVDYKIIREAFRKAVGNFE